MWPIGYFDKALALNPKIYQAHREKAWSIRIRMKLKIMLEEFLLPKKGPLQRKIQKLLTRSMAMIDKYYNKFIIDEMQMVDPEETIIHM